MSTHTSTSDCIRAYLRRGSMFITDYDLGWTCPECGIEHAPLHTKDSECQTEAHRITGHCYCSECHPVSWSCPECSVYHGAPCECGGRGYHREGCDVVIDPDGEPREVHFYNENRR